MILKSILLKAAESKRVEQFVRTNRWASEMTRRFVAGETIPEAVEVVQALNQQGKVATLAYLGESVQDTAMVETMLETYLQLLDAIKQNGLKANISVKLTALGLDISEELCVLNMQKLLEAAGEDLFVRIDMEGSEYTQRTLDIFYGLWEGEQAYRNVGVVIQAYLKRSDEDILRLNKMGARVRLCKGAYKEPPSVAYTSKLDVDTAYIRQMQRLLKIGNYPGLATHDAALISLVREYARIQQIDSKTYEFQMLHGVGRALQDDLVRMGYQVRVYVPFGTHWYPYMMRRMAERPSNLWFVVKNALKK